jgi:hypothetical protein
MVRWKSPGKKAIAGHGQTNAPVAAKTTHLQVEDTFRSLTLKMAMPTFCNATETDNLPETGLQPMTIGTKPSNGDLKAVLCVLIALLLAFHVGSALRGRGQFRDIHLGTALHYAQTKISLAETIIVGFNASGTPTIQELPVWQAAAGLAFKLLGTWWGWGNVVSLALFLPCLFPFFQIARLYLDERRAWWALIFFLAEPLVFIYAGLASTDGLSLALAVWFLYCGLKLVREPGLKWLVPACAFGILMAVSKLPFFMVTGLALFFLALWQSGFDFKRLGFLAAAGVVAGVVFLLWTHYTDAKQANALFPLVDLRLKNPSMVFWYFGDWHYRLSAGNWIKGGWRSLSALLGSFVLAGLVVFALANKKGNPVARCLLAGALLTTLVFSHLVLHHWHYYLMFTPAVALLCAEGLAVFEVRFALQGSKPAFSFFVSGLIGLSLLQGLMGMKSLTYDPYPAKLADLIRTHTVPTDKLVIMGGGWGGEELFRSNRQGLSVWNAHIFEDPANYAKLKSLGYNKLVMVSESPFQNAIQVINPGQADFPRELCRDQVTPLVEKWPTAFQTEDVLIKEIP